jgi:hypothetical protein
LVVLLFWDKDNYAGTVLVLIPWIYVLNSFRKVAGYKNQLTKVSNLLCSNNEQNQKEYRKTIPFTIDSKKYQISRNKLNKGCKGPLSGEL